MAMVDQKWWALPVPVRRRSRRALGAIDLHPPERPVVDLGS
ncbi:MAG: hypothetical protein ACLPYY_13560 [Acidimicrobiales bacterium]